MGVKIEVFRVSLMTFTLVSRSGCLNKLYVNRLIHLLGNKETYRSCKRPSLLNSMLYSLTLPHNVKIYRFIMFTLNRWWCICRFQWWCFGYQTKRSILKNTSSSERFITDLIIQVHISNLYSIVMQLLLYDHIMCSHVSEGDLPTWWEIACKYSLEVFHLMQIFR